MKEIKTYNTEMVNGMDSIINPDIYYKNNYGFRKANLPFDYTDEEIVEYFRCERSPVYFIETYCKLYNPDTTDFRNITLYDYQIQIIENYKNNKFNIVSIPRQAGLSTIMNLLALHEAMFGVDKQINIFYPNIRTCTEKIDLMKNVYGCMPFFLKAGTVKMGIDYMTFDNGCRICANTSKIPGYQIHKLFIDNFSAMPQNSKFLTTLFPIVSALKKSSLLISSRQNNALDKFREMFLDSIEEKNNFVPYYVFWWQIPGRDEAWKTREVRNLGSEAAFDREYPDPVLEWIDININK
jgi:hypothetical protein